MQFNISIANLLKLIEIENRNGSETEHISIPALSVPNLKGMSSYSKLQNLIMKL